MEGKELIRRNQAIALFMCPEQKENIMIGMCNFSIAPAENTSYSWDIDCMEYHTSMDWLFPVASKISKYENNTKREIGNGSWVDISVELGKMASDVENLSPYESIDVWYERVSDFCLELANQNGAGI